MQLLWLLLIACGCLFRRKASYEFTDLSYEEIVAQSHALAGRFASVHAADALFGREYRMSQVLPLLL